MQYLDYVKAFVKSAGVLLVMSLFFILNVPCSLVVALTAKRQTTHPTGKPLTAEHSRKYIDKGSSGKWEYWNSNLKYLRWFNNYEDGLLREPSGKNSAAVKGKERTVLNMWLWSLRNPFNWGKRTLPFFYCPVNDCTVTYAGKYDISDKEPTKGGWYFVKAVHKKTKRSYYGFRWVKHYKDDKVRQLFIGFKLKPSHRDNIQDSDDLDKAFTLRFPVLQSRF